MADLFTADGPFPARSVPGGREAFFKKWPGYVDQIYALRDTLKKVVPTYVAAMLAPRGLSIPLDPWMRGTLRWARKLGGGAAVWRPETRMRLEETTGASEQSYAVNLIPDSLILGSIIQVSPTFKGTVTDFDTIEFTITLGEELDSPRFEGETIKVWGWPITTVGAFLKDATLIRVETPNTLQIARGDRLQIPVDAEMDSPFAFTTPHNVTKAEFIEESGDFYRYDLTLEKPLARDVTTNETVYMRAFPAYFSGRVTLPDFSAAFLKLIGPFLLDFMSGPLVRDTDVEEFFSVRQYRADRDPITPLLPVDSHNAQILRMPIRAEQMLFWRRIRGKINHDTSNAVLTADDDGLCRIVESLRPTMRVPDDLYASGSIACVATSLLANNEGFDLNDGTNLVRFEYKVDGSHIAAPGKTVIDVSAVTTAESVAALTQTAIVNSVLDFTVTRSGRRVNIVHNQPGVIGNNLIEESVDAVTFTVEGLTGGGGDLRWLMVVNLAGATEAELRIAFRPNADQVYTLNPGNNNVIAKLNPTDDPATHIDLRISTDAGATIKISDWSLHGSRVSYVETETVVRIETDQWAGSFLFLKPLWPNFDLLKPFPLLDKMNGGGVLL